MRAERPAPGQPSALTCQASNNNITAPLSIAINIDMALKPLWVRIQGPKRPFSANKSTEIICQTAGAKPKPSISWWKASTRLKSTRESVSIDGNVTTSILSFTPTIEDAGKFLSCRAVQPDIPESGMEDGWKLEIYHVPVVNLELGSNLKATDVVEGSDVYFECNIKSNPWVYKIQWMHEGEILVTNHHEGVIVSNQSLVLQGLRRDRGGVYMCSATNEEGEGKSNKLLLDVKFKPYCKHGQQLIYNIAKNEEAKISCELQANPQDPVHFTWKFNNSEANSMTLPINKVMVFNSASNALPRKDGFSYATSVASYTPKNSSDYGTVSCIGANRVGEQDIACVFHIVPAGKPDAVSNCSVGNQTIDSLQVTCLEGFDGGLPQRFIVQVYNAQTNFLMKNATFDNAQFSFDHLPSAATFNIEVYAYNKKGIGEVLRLQTSTLKGPEKQTGGVAIALQLTPLLGTLVGVTGFLVILAIVLVMLARCKSPRRAPPPGPNPSKPSYGERHQDGSSMPLNATDTESVDSLDKSPDILLDGKISTVKLSSSSKSAMKHSNPAMVAQSYAQHLEGSSFNSIGGQQQYVQIDPTAYGVQTLGPNGRPPIYRLQGNRQMYLRNDDGTPCDGTEARTLYDRVYEDNMLKYRTSPGGVQGCVLPDDSLPCPELYINCHSPVQAVYSNPATMAALQNGAQSVNKMATPFQNGGQTSSNNMSVGWYPTLGHQQGHVMNYVGGPPQPMSRTVTPVPTAPSRDKEYLLMSPGKKPTILPKTFGQPGNAYHHQGFHGRMNSNSFDSTQGYNNAPVMPRNQVMSPTSIPKSSPVKYERLTPEESLRSFHIRLDPPSVEPGLMDSLINKKILDNMPTDMCEMSTDFSCQTVVGSDSETKLLESQQ